MLAKSKKEIELNIEGDVLDVNDFFEDDETVDIPINFSAIENVYMDLDDGANVFDASTTDESELESAKPKKIKKPKKILVVTAEQVEKLKKPKEKELTYAQKYLKEKMPCWTTCPKNTLDRSRRGKEIVCPEYNMFFFNAVWICPYCQKEEQI